MGIALLGLILSQDCLAGKKNAASNAKSNAASDKSNAKSNAASDKSKASKSKSDNYVDVVISNNTDLPIKIKGSHLKVKKGQTKESRVSEIYKQKTVADATDKGATSKDTTIIIARGKATYKLNTNKQYEYNAMQIKADKSEVKIATKHGNDFTSDHTWAVGTTAATADASNKKDAKKDKAKKKASKDKSKKNAASTAVSAAASAPAAAAAVKKNTPAAPAIKAVLAANAISNASSNANSASGSGM